MARDIQAKDTKARILAAAAQLFLEAGYEETPLVAILERAGTSNGSFFHCFPTKSAVAETLCLQALDSRFAALLRPMLVRPGKAELTGGVRGLIGALLAWTIQEPASTRLIALLLPRLREETARARVARLVASLDAKITTWVAPLIRSGRMRDLPPRMVAALVLGPAEALCLDWLRGLGDIAPTAYEDTLVEAACAALRAPAPVKTPPVGRARRAPASGRKDGDLFG